MSESNEARQLRRAEKYYKHIEASVKYLVAASSRAPRLSSDEAVNMRTQVGDLLTDLSEIIPVYGLSINQLSFLIDIVLDTANSSVFVSNFKMYIVHNFLICYDSIDSTIVMKIVSSFSLATPFHNSTKPKKLGSTIQTKLLKWLVHNFVNFKFDDKQFTMLLPILFNYISIGYARPHIIRLIVLILYFRERFNPNFKLRGFLTPWRVEYILEFWKKEPRSDDLAFFALVVKKLIKQEFDVYATLNSNYYYRLENTIPNNLRASYFTRNIFVGPNLDKLVEAKMNYLQNSDFKVSSVEELIEEHSSLREFKEIFNDYLQMLVYLVSQFTSHTSSSSSSSNTAVLTGTGDSLKKRKISDVQHSLTSSTDKSIRTSVYEDFASFNSGCFNLNQFVSNIDKVEFPSQIGSLVYYFAYCEASLFQYDSVLSTLYTNIGELTQKLLQNDRLTYMSFPVYYFISFADDATIKKLNKWCEHTLLTNGKLLLDNDSILQKQKAFYGAVYLLRYSNSLIPTMRKLLDGEIEIVNETGNLQYLDTLKFWDLIKNYPVVKWDEFEKVSLFIGSYLSKDSSLIHKVLDSISILFEKWRYQLTSHPIDDESEVFYCMNKQIGILIDFFERQFSCKEKAHLQEKLSFSRFLHSTVHKIPSKYMKLSNIVLGPSIVYDFYFSNNPNIIDAICSHINQSKKYFGDLSALSEEELELLKFNVQRDISSKSDSEEKDIDYFTNFRNLHNSYILDFCNIIWRDKSFESSSKSATKGFLMPEPFIEKLFKQRYYHYSDTDLDGQDSLVMAQLQPMKRTYNLFYAPAFASIITELIRNFEDEYEENSVRLAGPLNKLEFNKLTTDEDQVWLPYSDYDLLCISVLRKLHELGFKGVDILLFNSLKSLLSKSREQIEQ